MQQKKGYLYHTSTKYLTQLLPSCMIASYGNGIYLGTEDVAVSYGKCRSGYGLTDVDYVFIDDLPAVYKDVFVRYLNMGFQIGNNIFIGDEKYSRDPLQRAVPSILKEKQGINSFDDLRDFIIESCPKASVDDMRISKIAHYFADRSIQVQERGDNESVIYKCAVNLNLMDGDLSIKANMGDKSLNKETLSIKNISQAVGLEYPLTDMKELGYITHRIKYYPQIDPKNADLYLYEWFFKKPVYMVSTEVKYKNLHKMLNVDGHVLIDHRQNEIFVVGNEKAVCPVAFRLIDEKKWRPISQIKPPISKRLIDDFRQRS